jgi:hypothetical protein
MNPISFDQDEISGRIRSMNFPQKILEADMNNRTMRDRFLVAAHVIASSLAVKAIDSTIPGAADLKFIKYLDE